MTPPILSPLPFTVPFSRLAQSVTRQYAIPMMPPVCDMPLTAPSLVQPLIRPVLCAPPATPPTLMPPETLPIFVQFFIGP